MVYSLDLGELFEFVVLCVIIFPLVILLWYDVIKILMGGD